jgi:hypothetical protein
MRHTALKLDGDNLSVFFSNAGDCPEQIIHSRSMTTGGAKVVGVSGIHAQQGRVRVPWRPRTTTCWVRRCSWRISRDSP